MKRRFIVAALTATLLAAATASQAQTATGSVAKSGIDLGRLARRSRRIKSCGSPEINARLRAFSV